MSHISLDMDAVRSEIGEYADTQTALSEREQAYKDLVGFVPPRIAARLAVTGAIDPKLLRLQEEVRNHALYPACFDTKTAQLIVFGMLLARLLDAATLHARAARRAGATWEEMQAVVSLAYLYGGIPSANRGAEIIAQLAEAESKDRLDTTVKA
ncbi:carboxymuconolactone decarboxylase family protein [Paraburkholderia sp. UYCP14C]|uniref:carboxymuconolactone decarboxylase family protein n=1 Tax=Paraburkholderia sp. UYCP14C TaxID=2511130 RepID=UPI001021E73B|nr:carboxymuconolactone decarboxylase family protein [Paraburkholderia sp. UYCP14C]RZF25796.1 carboxymuconolactone decarboxylase family protein [Paraburkholderia sp. UYCP14C]